MEGNKKRGGLAIFALLLLCVVVALVAGDYFNILSRFGGSSHTAEEVLDVTTNDDGTIEIAQERVPYVVNVDFSPALLQEAQHENKLIIMTQNASAPVEATKNGLWNLPVFKQTKAMIFYGEGTFSVDLAALSDDNFIVDNQEKTITIFIPRPQLDVKTLPDKTEFFDSSNGILRFGEMELAPEINNKVETEGRDRITKALKEDTKTWEAAERFAKLSVKEIYEPFVKAQIDAAVQSADDDFAIPPQYSIKVEFRD